MYGSPLHCEELPMVDDNYCVAESILITSDEMGAKLPESYDFQDTLEYSAAVRANFGFIL